MNKKLMAVAVAGALAAPAMAFAQASTVQIYGTVNVEYGYVNQANTAAGASRHNADALNSGASNIGFKGEEKLGSGLSVWFQCESQLNNWPSSTAAGWCTRNSALGLKGGFGNVYIGTWDSPIKQAVATTRMLNETGWLGAQHLLLSGPNSFAFSTRNNNSVNYNSPNFGGFSVSAQYTTQQNALDAVSTDTRAERRNLGLGAKFANGPLVVAAAWSKHEDATVVNRDDTAWTLGATYAFGKLKAGVTYVDAKKEPTATTDIKRKAWNLALDWQISAPGTIRLGYTQAGDFKGTATGAGADTGAKQWQIGYLHSLSKRTVAGIAFVKVDNDTNGTYNLTGLTNAVLGDSASAVAVSLKHTF